MKETTDFKFFPLILAILMGVMYSCRDGVLTEQEEDTDTALAVAEAADFYNSYVEGNIPLRAGRKEVHTMQVKPAWEYVTVSRNRQYTAVEVALRSEYGFIYTLPENEAKSEAADDHRYKASRKHFVILTDNYTRRRQMFMMTVVLAASYIERTNFQPFRKMAYLERDKNFSGLIFFHHPDGTMANGWLYEDGKILSDLHFTDNSTAPKYVTTRSACAVGVTIVYETTTCFDQIVTAGGNTSYSYHCTTSYRTEYYVEYSSCEGTGGGGGGYSGSYGGGGGSGNNGNNGSVAPKASTIFRNANMTAANWKQIEGMIDKIIQNCMGGNLYNALKKTLNGRTLTLQFSNANNGGGAFSFNGSTAGITLDMNAGSNVLLHELFHAYQSYQETPATFGQANLNQEFEAHYAQYLYLKALPEYKGSKWEKQYAKGRLKKVRELERYIDNKGKLLPSISNEVFDLFLQNDLKGAFMLSKEYMNKKHDYGREGVSNFSNIQTLTKGC